MPMRNLLIMAALGGAAWYFLKPKPAEATPEPVAEPLPQESDWFDWSSWGGFWDESAPEVGAGSGAWITDTYQSAADWLSGAWDNITE